MNFGFRIGAGGNGKRGEGEGVKPPKFLICESENADKVTPGINSKKRGREKIRGEQHKVLRSGGNQKLAKRRRGLEEAKSKSLS